MWTRGAYLVVFAIALLAAAPGATAQDGGVSTARLAATALVPVPAGAAMTLEFTADTGLNAALRQVIARRLIGRGYEVRPDAALVLRVETQAPATSRRERRLKFGGEGGSANKPERFGLRLHLATRPVPKRRGQLYRVTFTLAPPGGTPHWTGTAEARVHRRDRQGVSDVLAAALVDVLGESVETRPVPLD